MKTFHHNDRNQPDRGGSRTLWAGLALCLGLAISARAFAERSQADTLGGTSGSDASDDETVGTLPIIGGGSNTFEYHRYLHDVRPSFYLQGNSLDVLSAISSIGGRFVVTLAIVDPNLDVIRLTFHGAPRLALDRAIFEEAQLDVGLSTPRSFGSTGVVMSGGESGCESQTVNPGLTPLPVGALATAGPSSSAGFRWMVENKAGLRTALEVRVTRRFVVLTQSH